MPNMSYCRFENTYLDLQDCIDNMHKKCNNDRDERYRKRLLEEIKKLVESGEVDEALDNMNEAE